MIVKYGVRIAENFSNSDGTRKANETNFTVWVVKQTL